MVLRSKAQYDADRFTDVLRPFGRRLDARLLCPGELQCVVRSGVRRHMRARIGLRLSAGRVAIWIRRGNLVARIVASMA